MIVYRSKLKSGTEKPILILLSAAILTENFVFLHFYSHFLNDITLLKSSDSLGKNVFNDNRSNLVLNSRWI